MRRPLLLALCLVAPAVAWGQGIPPDSLPAGSGFDWEPVGDQGVSPNDLQFTPDGALWSVGGRMFRLAPPVGPGAPWTQLNTAIRHAILVLPAGATGIDTLFVSDHSGVYRSFDRGQTFTEVQDPGGNALIEGLAGTLIVGGTVEPAISYSTDRGATWAAVSYDPPETIAPVFSLFALPPTPEHPSGRALAGSTSGVAVSDDTARVFRPSGLFVPLDYAVEEMAAVEWPGGGGRRVIAGGFRNARPYGRAWYSDDDGETWAGAATFRDVADGGRSYQSVKAVVGIGGSSAYLILGRGAVYRTDDGGATWALAGRTPMPEPGIEYVGTALLGPDGRLYVGIDRAGATNVRSWVYRTAEPVIVASEPTPGPGDGLALSAVPNPTMGLASLVLTLPEASASVRVALYDVLGRPVAVVHEGSLAAGTHRLSLDASALPPGVYVARAVVGGRVATARLTLAR